MALLLTLLPLGGCGGGGSAAPVRSDTHPAGATTIPVAPAGAPTDAEVRNALQLPANVPLRAAGRAPAAQVRVVRGWLDALRAGHIARAASFFAVPSRFQNFTSIALIRSRAQAYVVTGSLPCGAKLTTAGGAAGFVVYEARLTNRPGARCGSGVGGVVRGAVLVRRGRMTEWYRLPDRSEPRRGQPVIPQGPLV